MDHGIDGTPNHSRQSNAGDAKGAKQILVIRAVCSNEIKGEDSSNEELSGPFTNFPCRRQRRRENKKRKK